MVLSMRGPRDGIDPATAAIIVREFESCPECTGEIDPKASEGLREDRDVIWKRGHNSSPHTCRHCGAELRIFVEEKAFGLVRDSEVSENAEESDILHFIPVDGETRHLRVNTFQMNVSKAPSETSPTRGHCSTPCSDRDIRQSNSRLKTIYNGRQI
jgi:hypothetical protein